MSLQRTTQLFMSSSTPSSSSSSSSLFNKLKLMPRLSNEYYALRHGQSKANIAKIISSDPIISTKEHGLTDVGKDQVCSSAIKFCQDYKRERVLSPPSLSAAAVAIYSSDFTRARETATIFAQTLHDHDIPLYFQNTSKRTGTSKKSGITGKSKNDDNNEDNEDNEDIENYYVDTPTIFENNFVRYDVRLRERYFGEFNGQSDSHYQDVWDYDCLDANHTKYDVESVNKVIQRTSSFILDLEKELVVQQQQEEEEAQQQQQQNDDDDDRTRTKVASPNKVILVAHGDVLQILQTAFLNVDGCQHRSLEHLETASVRKLLLVCE